jgi:hypothetical protein
MRYPTGASIEPAIETWSPAIPSEGYDAFDFIKGEPMNVFRAASTKVPADLTSVDAWIEKVITPSDGSPCGPPRSTLPEIIIDGQAGRIWAGCDEVEATVALGERVYLFTLFNDAADARAIFDALAATIDLQPIGA